MKIAEDEVVKRSLDGLENMATSITLVRLHKGLSDLPEMTPIEQLVYFHLAYLIWVALPGVLVIEPQKVIGKYRVDFLVIYDGDQFVVECDGHDFHERTKEQAQKDKKRDRYLQALGYKVYRFTGSEIWKSEGSCVQEAIGIFQTKKPK